VPAGIFSPAKAFLNARLDFCVSKPIKNQFCFFLIQNGVFFLATIRFCSLQKFLSGPYICSFEKKVNSHIGAKGPPFKEKLFLL